MIRKYLSLQSQIMHLQPDFPTQEPTRSKTKIRGKTVEPIPQVAKLLAKVQKITSDILFDEDEACSRWTHLRNEIVRESAERRKYHLDKGMNVDLATEAKASSRRTPIVEPEQDEEVFSMIGDLFSNLPDITSDPETGVSTLLSTDRVGQTVTIRDFGRWAGISPRRVLEEACKARLDFLPS